MKTMESIIHMDDWKRTGRVAPGEKHYTESEVKIMMRRYAEECVGTLWEQLPVYDDDNNANKAKELYELLLEEIANEVII